MHRYYVIAIALIGIGFAGVLFLAVPDAPAILVVTITGGVVGLFALFCLFGTYLPLRRFHPLQERFGFVAGGENPDVLTGIWEGCPVRIQYHELRKSRRARLSICLLVPLPVPSSVVFQRERVLHRLVKWSGLTRESQAEDPSFNRRVFAESENDAVVPLLVADAGVRAQVLALLSIPRSTVSLDVDGVGMTIGGHLGWPKYFKPDAVQKILSQLLQMAHYASNVLRHAPASVHQRAQTTWEGPRLAFDDERSFAERVALLRHPGRLAIFIAAVLLFLGPALTLWGARYQPISWRLHLIGLGVAGVFLVFYTRLVFVFVRGHSQSHRCFSTFMFAALVGFPTFWIGGLKVANGFLDLSAPFVVEGQILRRISKRPRIELRIELPDLNGTVSVRVSRERYRTAKPGADLPLLLSAGALGEPWVVRAALVEDQR
jgi:hypothetical protein